MTTVLTHPDAFVAVALPRQEEATSLVWRLAREVDTRVARQVSEADVGDNVVVVFEVVGTGSAEIVFALTRGESSPNALRTLTYVVDVA